MSGKRPQPKETKTNKKQPLIEELEEQFADGAMVTDSEDENGEEEFLDGEEEIEGDIEDAEFEAEEGEIGDEEAAGDEEFDGELGDDDDMDEEMVGLGKQMVPSNLMPDHNDIIQVDETLAETDTQLLKMKINSHLKVLSKFKELRETDKARSEYITELKEFYCQLYSYNRELMEIFFNLFSPHELSAFLEAMETERPVTIRTNTIKAKRKELAQALAQRRVELEPVGDWSKVGLKINESKVPIGATPEYLGGHYMLQSACSFLPVLALAPKPGEKVLDMAAAPGGKTTYIG